MVITRKSNATTHSGKPDVPRGKRAAGSVATEKEEAIAKKADEALAVSAGKDAVAELETKLKDKQVRERRTAVNPTVSGIQKSLTAKQKMAAAKKAATKQRKAAAKQKKAVVPEVLVG